jgi:hypothetical protein
MRVLLAPLRCKKARRSIRFRLATGATRLMTVRGFLTWYLTTVAIMTASGAGMWYGIQLRKNSETAAFVVPPVETSPPSQQTAEVQQTLPTTPQDQAALPRLRPSQSNAAALPPLHVPMQSDNQRQAASSSTQPWIARLNPQHARKVAARAPTYRSPRTVVARGEDAYTYYSSRSYATAYPPAMAPWRMQRYGYYYPPYGYYRRYPYYYYSAD